jgi:allophanate hydrolase subunit 2
VRGRLGGLEGRALRGGDVLPPGVPQRALLALAGRELPQALQPDYQDSITAEVIAGPQADHFDDAARQLFLSGEYRVSETSDRMGYRLEGAAIPHSRGADIVSDGMVRGSLQVPANGQPLLMMADGPPTGGYPKIAVVASADLHLLAQCTPGFGRVRFRETTVEAAQARQRALVGRLRQSLKHGAGDDDLDAW